MKSCGIYKWTTFMILTCLCETTMDGTYGTLDPLGSVLAIALWWTTHSCATSSCPSPFDLETPHIEILEWQVI
jgi:hypothetical protein